jgi:diacylglycerol kinase
MRIVYAVPQALTHLKLNHGITCDDRLINPVMDLIKLLVETLGKKRTLRVFAVLIFTVIAYFALITLDWIDWTWWWVVPSLVGLYLGIEVLNTAFSMTPQRSGKKDAALPKTKSKVRK